MHARPHPRGDRARFIFSVNIARSSTHEDAHPNNYSLTAAIGSRTASALLANAFRSSSVNSTSMICSNPLRPSLHGTPRKRSFMPYSPLSHAAHGVMRFDANDRFAHLNSGVDGA